MSTRQELIPLFGPLLETIPRAAFVLASGVVALAAASLFGRAVRAGRRLAVIGTWLPGLAAGVTARLAFASFVRAETAATDIDPLTIAGLLAFVAGHWMQHVLLCAGGLVVAWGTARTAAGTAYPGDDRAGARTTRSEALGKLGEALVASGIEAFGCQFLRNAVLDLGGWMVEIDHLVRAPDEIVVIETKAYSGFVSGAEDEIVWMRRPRDGRTISIPNSARQNLVHLRAVVELIAAPTVSVRALVVSAGNARFANGIKHIPVPVRELRGVLQSQRAIALFGQGTIDTAWRRVSTQASHSEARRMAHQHYVRRHDTTVRNLLSREVMGVRVERR